MEKWERAQKGLLLVPSADASPFFGSLWQRKNIAARNAMATEKPPTKLS
jgi:hypothetical protein